MLPCRPHSTVESPATPAACPVVPPPHASTQPGERPMNSRGVTRQSSATRTDHVLQRRLTSESVLQPPREDSEVSRSRRGSFRLGCPRFCPAGGRAPAAPRQPVRESAAARAPAPGPRLPRPSLRGLILAAFGSRAGSGRKCVLSPYTSGGASGGVEGREELGPVEGCGARAAGVDRTR